MQIPARSWCWFLACLALASSLAAQPPLSQRPIIDFRLPVFSPNNFKIWHLTASEAHILTQDRYKLTGVRLLMYADNTENQLEAEIETPSATGDIESRTITGPTLLHIRMATLGVELHGEDWSFEDHPPTGAGQPHERVFTMRRDVVATYSGDIGGALGPPPGTTATDEPQRTIIEAVRLEVRDLGDQTHFVFEGNVRFATPSLRLTCDRLEVFATRRPRGAAENSGDEGVQRVVALGNVNASQGGRSAVCARAEIEVRTEEATLAGSPVVLTDIEHNLAAEGSLVWLRRKDREARIENVRLTTSPLPNFGPPIPDATSADMTPTVVTAKRLDLHGGEAGGRYILTGSVHLTGTNLNATAERVEIITERTVVPGDAPASDAPAGTRTRERATQIIVEGSVVITQAGRRVTCGHAEVFPVQNRLVLTERPVVADTVLGMTVAGERMTLQPGDGQGLIEKPRVHGPPLPDFGATQGASGSNREQETIIEADILRLTNTGIEGHYVFDGAVRLTGTNLLMTCHQLEIFSQKDAKTPEAPAAPSGRIRRVLATGDVNVHQAERDASCDVAEVLPAEEEIILTGNLSVTEHNIGKTSTGKRAVVRRGDQSVEIEDAIIRGRIPARPSGGSAPVAP